MTLIYRLNETNGYPDHRMLKAIKASKATIHGLKRRAALQSKWRRERMTSPMIVRRRKNVASTMLPLVASPLCPGSGSPQARNHSPIIRDPTTRYQRVGQNNPGGEITRRLREERKP